MTDISTTSAIVIFIGQSELYHECELYPVVTGPELTFVRSVGNSVTLPFPANKVRVLVVLTKNVVLVASLVL